MQKLFVLSQSRALETLSHGVTIQHRSFSPVYNAVTSPTLYKAEEAERLYSNWVSIGIIQNKIHTWQNFLFNLLTNKYSKS